MGSSTTKKVCVRCSNLRLITGYVSPQAFVRGDGIEILDRNAQAQLIPYDQLRAVYFVRDFEDDPESSQKKVFASRPKSDGLWVRLRFRDGEVLEGVLPNELLQISGRGFMVTPPDPNANTQKVFVPTTAIDSIKVLGVVGSPIHRRRGRRKLPPPEDQMELFQKQAPGSE